MISFKRNKKIEKIATRFEKSACFSSSQTKRCGTILAKIVTLWAFLVSLDISQKFFFFVSNITSFELGVLSHKMFF